MCAIAKKYFTFRYILVCIAISKKIIIICHKNNLLKIQKWSSAFMTCTRWEKIYFCYAVHFFLSLRLLTGRESNNNMYTCSNVSRCGCRYKCAHTAMQQPPLKMSRPHDNICWKTHHIPHIMLSTFSNFHSENIYAAMFRRAETILQRP